MILLKKPPLSLQNANLIFENFAFLALFWALKVRFSGFFFGKVALFSLFLLPGTRNPCRYHLEAPRFFIPPGALTVLGGPERNLRFSAV